MQFKMPPDFVKAFKIQAATLLRASAGECFGLCLDECIEDGGQGSATIIGCGQILR
jgi:hypothetical protein